MATGLSTAEAESSGRSPPAWNQPPAPAPPPTSRRRTITLHRTARHRRAVLGPREEAASTVRRRHPPARDHGTPRNESRRTARKAQHITYLRATEAPCRAELPPRTVKAT
ncbi:hypothetical protein GCM10009544_15380 [Streptomyces stramineus]|uniref:Uncharacterized protein n=1 Tax=Streptomyces stramineus TaxID=173861 RepID=A0ABP3JH69_9ACTN